MFLFWPFFFFFSFLPCLLNYEAAPQSITVGQNLTNHCAARAESPCCLAQIQEETVMVVNQHPNSVTQGQVRLSFFPVYRSNRSSTKCSRPCKVLMQCLRLNTYLNQQWILPSFFIIPPSFSSTSFSLSTVLPSLFFTGATSICHCRCVFVCLVCISLITVALHQCKLLPSFSSLSLLFCLTEAFVGVFVVKGVKDRNSSLVAFQTNSTCLGDRAKYHNRY